MGDDNTTFNSQRVLQWCFTIQSERIRRALMYEAASLKLLPTFHREILALAKIAHLMSLISHRATSFPGRVEASDEPPSPTAVSEEIRKLDPEDRHLLRKAVEELILNSRQVDANGEGEETTNLEENINDKK
jgi:hypothetical protein